MGKQVGNLEIYRYLIEYMYINQFHLKIFNKYNLWGPSIPFEVSKEILKRYKEE